MASEQSIILDYYEGAYGSTIRIATQSVEDLNRIQKIFRELENHSRQAVNMTEIEGLKASGLNQLILKWVPDKQEVEKSLVLVSRTSAGISFEWTMASKRWKRVVGLIDGLIEHGASGHQYLTKEGVDDAIVELAFKE